MVEVAELDLSLSGILLMVGFFSLICRAMGIAKG